MEAWLITIWKSDSYFVRTQQFSCHWPNLQGGNYLRKMITPLARAGLRWWWRTLEFSGWFPQTIHWTENYQFLDTTKVADSKYLLSRMKKRHSASPKYFFLFFVNAFNSFPLTVTHFHWPHLRLDHLNPLAICEQLFPRVITCIPGHLSPLLTPGFWSDHH